MGHINTARVLENQLSEKFDKSDFVVKGVVRSLVSRQPGRLGFVFDIYSVEHEPAINNDLSVNSLKRLRLSWYAKEAILPVWWRQ